MTEQEALRELAAAAARIVVLEAEARACKVEMQRLHRRAQDEWDYSERILKDVRASRGSEVAVSVRLDEMMAAIREESAALGQILRYIMRDSVMDEEE